MPNVWNIGNTTVRNPNRIENALKIFLDDGFSGNAKGSENEIRLHSKLKERGVLEYDGEASDWNGRKWRAAFYQLGFISYETYLIQGERLSVKDFFHRIHEDNIQLPYQLTKAGFKLISSNSVPELEEIYLRQFCCYELPNSLESGYPTGKLKPFILFLQVLNELQSNSQSGLTKFETGLFLQPFANHDSTLVNQIIRDILHFRELILGCKNNNERKTIKDQYLESLQHKANIDPNSVVRDYSDTSFRYFSLSGLFTRLGDTIVIRDNKLAFVRRLLGTEPNFLFNHSPYEYFTRFYSNSYPIPIDQKAFALEEVQSLSQSIRNQQNPLLGQVQLLNADSDISLIQQRRLELIEYNNREREVDYAREQQNDQSLKEILNYLRSLNGENFPEKINIEDKPSFLEWAVWRCFLVIDDITNPIHETRRFPIDQDFFPRNTAPGGGSDSIFEFEEFVLVVEVTLTTSHRQMAVESEPVRRHTVQYKQLYPNKDVYCIFIAPSVDNNVVETFRIGVWYNAEQEEFVNIIPMTLQDFINSIETLCHKRFNNLDFKNLLDRCLVFRNVRAPMWKQNISREVLTWKTRLIER